MARKDLQNTLDLLLFRPVNQTGELHGYGVVLHIQRASDDLLRVIERSLYTTLHSMEQSGWFSARWTLSDDIHKAKYYKMTSVGRKRMESADEDSERLVKAARAVLLHA
jgi:PadR family transcriptional regulator PadR